MSDPVSNAALEDVLAQVRRLVLQDGPPPSALRSRVAPVVLEPTPLDAAPPEPASEAPFRGRLVLTPAQRVEGEEAEPEEPAAVPAAPPPVLVLSAPLRAGPTRPRRVARPDEDEPRPAPSALSPASGEWEPDGSEALDWSLGAALEDLLSADAAAAAPPVFRHRSARMAAPAEAPPAASPAPAPTAGLPLDEAALRAMIAEAVRAELEAQLAGELGERVTRNLRRLVRREVFRVLETRDEP